MAGLSHPVVVLLAALLVTALAAEARAQRLVWERVGAQAYDVTLPSIAPDGTMWASGYEGTLRLDPPYGFAQPWVSVINEHHGAPILTLGQDTLVAQRNTTPVRSVDNGASFQPAPVDATIRVEVFEVIPYGLPHGGTIVAGSYAVEMGAYSRDRGASWARSVMPGHEDEALTIEAIAVVRSGPRAGRVVGAGFGGLVTSDDGGATYAPVPGWWQYFRFYASHVAALEGAAPGGGDRLVALVNDPQHVPYAELIVAVSDDDGESWREVADLLGDPNAAGEATVDFGGGRAVIVMDGGHVWQSADGGETWTIVGVVPGSFVDDPVGNGRTDWALQGPDGRLYVGGRALGGANPGWAFRTVGPLVAGESPPSEPPAVGVSVRPNPARGHVEIVVSLAEAGPVHVVAQDVLGREVAVLLNGTLPAGERVVSVDTSSWAAGVYVVRAAAGSIREALVLLTVAP